MKRKYIALVLGIFMAAVPVMAGLASVSGVWMTVQAAQADTIVYGEIIEIDADTITIAAGTINFEAINAQPADSAVEEADETLEEMSEEMTEDASEQPAENVPSLLDRNGEELTVLLTDKTVVKSIAHTEGEVSSSTSLKVGTIAAFQINGDQEITAVSIMGSANPEVPEKPEGEVPEKPDGEAPEKPEGEAPEKPEGEAPEKPEGMGQGGPGGMEPPEGMGQGGPGGMEPPEGMGQGGSGGMEPPEGMGQGGPGGHSSGVDSYDAVSEYTEDTVLEGEDIASEGTDENAVLVSASDAEVTVKDCTVTRRSGDSTGGDTSSFYGVGAALLATDGTLSVSGTEIMTDAAGGAGVFAYGDGTVYISDSTVNTQQNTSGGIHAAGGGTLYAWNLDVTTNGESAAAIRSDRGGGTMVIEGGRYTSNGLGSPAVYCTADISVKDAELTATGSEAICIEGLNTIRLYDCDLSGAMTDQEQNDITWNVIVYQSMSGDSVEGNGTFQMTGGTLTAENGGMFYTTNTESTILLEDVSITYAKDNPFFLQATGNANARGWGSSGSNGADCLFTAIRQEMEGNVIWDSISTLDFYMMDGSSLTGAIVDDETWAGEGGSGYCSVVIDETSSWIVTGDSVVTSLANAGTIMDEDGNSVTIIGTDGFVYVVGSSEYVITVKNYEEQADTTGAAAVSVWENYEAENPLE